jgi:DNA-binding XRE family transcriptional regulator
MLKQDRIRSGLTVDQLAWRLGVSPRKYRELEASDCHPDSETYDRVCELFGWPQTFMGRAAGERRR